MYGTQILYQTENNTESAIGIYNATTMVCVPYDEAITRLITLYYNKCTVQLKYMDVHNGINATEIFIDSVIVYFPVSIDLNTHSRQLTIFYNKNDPYRVSTYRKDIQKYNVNGLITVITFGCLTVIFTGITVFILGINYTRKLILDRMDKYYNRNSNLIWG